MQTSVSARSQARLAGALYLVIILAAMFAEAGVRGALIVDGNAAATAHNILASSQFYRLGGGADLLTVLCDIGVAALFYDLFKPVGPVTALAAALFRLAHAAIFGVAAILYFGAITLLASGGASAFTVPQLQGLALLALRLHGVAYNIALVFFGVHCLLLGSLVIRSGFLPALLGWLLVVAGACYLVNSATHLVFTGLDFFPWILLPGLVAESGLTLWLLIVGLDPARWHDRMATGHGDG